MSHLPFLIQLHFNQFLILLVRVDLQTLGLILIPSLLLSQPINQPSAMLTNSDSHGNDQVRSTWIPDSGASFHVTGEPQHIKQFAHFDGPHQIFIGNEGLYISSTGSSSFVPPYDSYYFQT